MTRPSPHCLNLFIRLLIRALNDAVSEVVLSHQLLIRERSTLRITGYELRVTSYVAIAQGLLVYCTRTLDCSHSSVCISQTKSVSIEMR